MQVQKLKGKQIVPNVGCENEVDTLDVSASHIGPPTPYRFLLLLEATLESTGTEYQFHAPRPSWESLEESRTFINVGVKNEAILYCLKFCGAVKFGACEIANRMDRFDLLGVRGVTRVQAVWGLMGRSRLSWLGSWH
jgi:hypothetical protein